MGHTIRESATEAAINTPTDWAALGARILAVAHQATAMHLATVARLQAQDRWSVNGSSRTLSAEPKQ
jgi:hypothetical protein